MKQSLPTESERQQNSRCHLMTKNTSPISQAFVDNRESTATQRQLMAKMASSPQAIAQRKFSEQIHNSSHMTTQRQQMAKVSGGVVQRVEGEEELMQGKFKPIQRVEEEELLQGKFSVAQRAEEEELLQGQFAPIQRVEEEELMQGKFDTAQLAQASTEKINNTGLPDNLKQGIENLSGMSMDNVKVHYNSSKPAQLNALAYAQGTDIHVGAGQEKHLPHEAWHVVQQAQGRVKPTVQMKDGVGVNNDQGLEREADLMGAKAVSSGVEQSRQDLGGSIESDPIGLRAEYIPIRLRLNSAAQLTYHYSANAADCKDVGDNDRPKVSVEEVVKQITNAEVVKYRDATDGGDMYIKTDWHVSGSDSEVHFTAVLGMNKKPWKSDQYPVRTIHGYPNATVKVFNNELKAK